MRELILSQVTTPSDTKSQGPQAPLGYTLWNATSPMILLAARAHRLSPSLDLSHFQRKLILDMQAFERDLQHNNIRAEQILIAKYFMCALLDEALEYEWLKGQGLWQAHALLFHFFQEANADEKFFTLVERLQQEVTVNIALLELAYMVLVYGFQGKHREMNNGYFILLQKMDELYHQLNWHYDDFRKSLFISDRHA